MELCSHSRSNSRENTGWRAQCKIRFPPKELAFMVEFRFWSGRLRTTEWSVDGGFCTTEWSVDDGFCQVIMLWAWLLGLCNCQNPCSKTHSSVFKGTERSWNSEDLERNPTEYTDHTIGKLANFAAFRSRGKGPNQQVPTFTYHKLPVLILIFTFVI